MNTDQIKLRKDKLREKILKIRNSLPQEEQNVRSASIWTTVKASDFYHRAKYILCYVSFGSEVQTRTFMRDSQKDGKIVYVPKIVHAGQNHEMKFYLYNEKSLVRSAWGIDEPPEEEDKVYQNTCDAEALIIVPGTVFDRERGRLGYRGGFYDRFLGSHPLASTCAVAYDFQVVDSVPQDIFDIKPQKIVTESSVY